LRIPVVQLFRRDKDNRLIVSCNTCQDPKALGIDVSLSGGADGKNLVVNITRGQMEEFYSRQKKLAQMRGSESTGDVQGGGKEQAIEQSLDSSRMKCLELGFKSGSEKFGECVLKLSR